jgi:hypothetical protein
MSYNIQIVQPGGLGDILYLQSLVKSLECDTVFWPVYDHYLEDCNKYLTNDKVIYLSHKDNSQSSRISRVLNFDAAHLSLPSKQKSFMYPKYQILNKNPRDWICNFSYKRDLAKEDLLYNKLVKTKEFKLVNISFGSSSESITSDNRRLDLLNKFKDDDSVIYIKPIEGFSLFDWSKIIELASEIHTVETSLVYLVEYLKTTEKLFMYLKGSKENFLRFFNGWDYINELHLKHWIYEAL